MINLIKHLIPPPKIWSRGIKKKTDNQAQGMEGKKKIELKKRKEVKAEPEANEQAGDEL